ncbi:hypothetical protein CPT32_27035 [Rhizobium sophoriradicis]|nr:hypothetical protein CPT32_27035 [Rhizobium sophoriradicis]PDS73632.1 hypothetical protein CO667_31905 [Rhizobium sp. L43]
MKKWHTGAAAEAHLSGHVSNQMPLRRNVRALARCSRPIFAAWRLNGASQCSLDPWIPALDMISFVRETMGSETRMHHWPKLHSSIVGAVVGGECRGHMECGIGRRDADNSSPML